MSNKLFTSLVLPNGTTLPNRIAKAAISENMAGNGQLPNNRIARLYKTFAEGGAGLIITGNVMVAPLSIGEPGNIVLQRNTDLAPFRQWAQAGKSKDGQIWMQINHPGRQVFADLGQPGWAPSEVTMKLGKHTKLFAKPRVLSEDNITEIIQQFADTARQAEAAGFNGVQMHAAHGYLISQFLSPLTNLRQDKWGGSLENRARFLIEVVKAVKSAVGYSFCVSVKLNSADFQRGGFSSTDALEVVKMLNASGLDLVEVSGGNYESPAITGETSDDSTLSREAYFLEFAAEIAKVATMPIMTTGGIKRKEVAEMVLNQGVEMVGIATALAMDPYLPKAWKEGKNKDGLRPTLDYKDKAIKGLISLAYFERQLIRISSGKTPKLGINPIINLIRHLIRNKALTYRYLCWTKKAI
jgi:2,4-dienoyl-CoA reductase-like NADH-dependent reductase (Old Yellow Enzyme family)